MSTNEPMTQEQLDAIQERVNAATDGPWAPWLDQDGQPHMHGRLMVGVAAGVIPDGETWVEGPDVNNPIAHTFTPEDRAFISHAREDVPALLAEVERLRALTTVTNEMIERGARALYERPTPSLDLSQRMSWDRIITLSPFYTAEAYRNHARAVLGAALGTGEEA